MDSTQALCHRYQYPSIGLCLWSDASYSYSRIGEQKRQEQTQKRYGNRISILGIWEPDCSFDYALVKAGFKSNSYVQVMNWQAEQAAQRLEQTGQITGIVLDNSSIHRSKLAQAHEQQWQEQGLFLFWLPKYVLR